MCTHYFLICAQVPTHTNNHTLTVHMHINTCTKRIYNTHPHLQRSIAPEQQQHHSHTHTHTNVQETILSWPWTGRWSLEDDRRSSLIGSLVWPWRQCELTYNNHYNKFNQHITTTITIDDIQQQHLQWLQLLSSKSTIEKKQLDRQLGLALKTMLIAIQQPLQQT